MITLTLKNKSLEAFDRLLDQAAKRPFAIINEFEITPLDLFLIVTELDSPEMEDRRAEFRSRFNVETVDNTDDAEATIFDFFSLKREFVDKWVKSEYSVIYQGVPIRLVEDDRTRL